MKTSTEILSTARLVGYEKAVEILAKAGFDAWDFSLFEMARFNYGTKTVNECDHALSPENYKQTAKKLRQIGLDNGIVCNQSHAPFPSHVGKIADTLKMAIEASAIAGAEICVIHPVNYLSATENAKMYLPLVDFAKQHGVKIATENMFGYDKASNRCLPHACATPTSMLEHLSAVNDENFVCCLDIGHAEMREVGTNAVEMIYAINKQIKALHIHDNDLLRDHHATPFTMKINYAEIVKALKDVGYSGYLTLECDNHYKNLGYTADTVKEGAKAMYNSVKRISDMF